MKYKYIIILAATLALAGCEKNPEYKEGAKIVLQRPLINKDLEIVAIDGCEYLFGDWANATVLSHKGNCKFCAERAAQAVRAK